MPELIAYYETRIVGRIEVSADGPTFTYEPSWLQTQGAFPISILMPLTLRPVKPEIFLPWASNLLPESSALRAVSLKIGSSSEDVIAILSEIGRDTAGALSIGKPGSAGMGGLRSIPDDTALERIINELPSKPFLIGDDGVSMSLAGAQTKLGVAKDSNGRLCIPINGAPSTHILKPDVERLPGSVQNEALCMVLARRCGLYVPEVTTGKAGSRSYYLVKRYDRVEQNGRWRRLHQEDFCQALGKPPSAKYESNQTGVRGPTLAEIFSLTRNTMAAPDILNLLDYVLFNVIACNTDSHAKNYSLMISGQGVKLAPMYDVMCAAVWEHVTHNMAQKIAGKNRGDHLKKRHWNEFASTCGLNASRLFGRIESLAALVLREVHQAGDEVRKMPAGDDPVINLTCEAIEARIRRLMNGLNEDQDVQAASSSATLKRQRKPKKQKAT